MKPFSMILTAFLPLFCATADVIQIDFGDYNSVSVTSYNGSTWNRADGSSSATGDIADLRDNANQLTGVSMTWDSFSGFQSSGRAEGGTGSAGNAADGLSTWTAATATADPNHGVTYTADNTYFPWSVVRTYSADNTSSGRDARISLTFSSASPLLYSFWVVSSYDHNNPVSGTATRGTFQVGSDALVLEGATVQAAADSFLDSNETAPGSVKYAVGRIGTGTFLSSYNAVDDVYELTLDATGNGVYLNGLVIETAAIPEPNTLALLGLALLLPRLLRRR